MEHTWQQCSKHNSLPTSLCARANHYVRKNKLLFSVAMLLLGNKKIQSKEREQSKLIIVVYYVCLFFLTMQLYSEVLPNLQSIPTAFLLCSRAIGNSNQFETIYTCSNSFCVQRISIKQNQSLRGVVQKFLSHACFFLSIVLQKISQ